MLITDSFASTASFLITKRLSFILVHRKDRNVKVSVLQVDRCKPILGLNAFDHAPVRQHLERELVQSPVQDSQIQDWPKATTFLGYDEVRAVKPLPHLGWRDRLDCILCQEDSNLLAQDKGVPDCHRRLKNAFELWRLLGELNRVAESNCACEPASVSHVSRRCASGSNGTIDIPVVVQRKGVGVDGTEGGAF